VSVEQVLGFGARRIIVIAVGVLILVIAALSLISNLDTFSIRVEGMACAFGLGLLVIGFRMSKPDLADP